MGESANQQAREILQEAKEVADDTIRIFQKAGPGASLKDLEKTRERLRGEIGKTPASPSPYSPRRNSLTYFNRFRWLWPKKLRKGDTVRIISMGLKGTVSTLPGCGLRCAELRFLYRVPLSRWTGGRDRRHPGICPGWPLALTPSLKLLATCRKDPPW